jgi:peroxiredoxin
MAEKTLAENLKESELRCRTMDAPLAERLQAFADDVRSLNAEFADVVDRMIDRLKESGAGESAPAPGEAMPDFLLPDQSGRLVSLNELIRKGPVAIAFHRGNWCPYCRINASALAAIHGELKALGGDLVAITPDREKFNSELKADAQALFPILSDMDNAYALAVNVAFWVGDEKQRYMKAAGWDISPFHGNDFWTLPIPATFVVGTDGRVKARFLDPDYRRRMGVEDLVAAVKSCAP